MDINDVFKFSGPVDVILRTKVERTIGGITYAAHQPITILENVVPSFSYGGQFKDYRQGDDTFLISHRTAFPLTLVLMGASFSEKLAHLIFSVTASANMTYYETIVCPASAIKYLPSDQQQINNIFLYKDGELSTYTYNSTTNAITFTNYSATSTYILFYSYLDSTSFKYGLASPSNPYFEIEMFGRGNVNNTSSNFYIKIGSCSLSPQLNMSFGGQYQTVSLTFNIMTKDIEQTYMIIG